MSMRINYLDKVRLVADIANQRFMQSKAPFYTEEQAIKEAAAFVNTVETELNKE